MSIDRIGTRFPEVAIHITGWVLFITLSWYFTLLLSPLSDKQVLVYSTGLLIGLFYANYRFFVPRIGNKWHLLLYSLAVISLLIVYFRIPSLLLRLPEPVFVAHPRLPPPHPGMGLDPMHPRGEFRHQMAEYNRVRLLLFALVYIFSTSIGVLELVNRYRRKQQEAEHAKAKAQLQLLTSQVNPHFLFNTLNAIYYLSASKSDKAPEAVLQLADILRYTLAESLSEYVPLQSEMDFLRRYIELQHLRLTDKTTVDLLLPQDVDGLKIAPLLLIPYVENCFKYGVSAHVQSTISVKISVAAQHELRAVLSNRIFGQGHDGLGLGMQTAEKRLSALYPGRHTINVQNDGDLFTVLLLVRL